MQYNTNRAPKYVIISTNYSANYYLTLLST